MNDPLNQIVDVVKNLTTTQSPELQLKTIQTYFTPDAAFDHPLGKVLSGTYSRQRVVGLYQWYRIQSPTLELEVKSVAFDERTNTVFLDVEQVFHIFLSPFKPHPARLTTRMDLVKGVDGLYRIAKQTDFYQPEDIGYLLLPPVSPLISFAKQIGGIVGGASALFCQAVFGWWTTGNSRRLD